jgi:protein scribble
MLHTSEVNPNKSPLRIQFIAVGGPVDRDGKLKIGDEVLSINGINLKGMRFDDALAVLQNSRTNELHLVVQRTAAHDQRNGAKRQLLAGELPYGDRSLDGSVEEVELLRDSKNSLGLSIVGGVDHCSHPFGVTQPGVFISKISVNSPAAQCKRLRVGDRILVGL